MTNKKQEKLNEYLKNINILRHTLSNDLFLELAKFAPNDLIINRQNINDRIRQNNKEFFINVIRKFLHLYNFEPILQGLFTDYDEIIEKIFIAYVYEYIKSEKTYKKIDIFKNPLCLCYCDIPPFLKN